MPSGFELDTVSAGDQSARPASYDSGFELIRLLLTRLEVLGAALQEVKELRRNAAEAPGEVQ
jgi:hypothetical protein